MHTRWKVSLALGALALGAWAGTSAAAPQWNTGSQSFNVRHMGHWPSPLNLAIPIRMPDALEAVSIGRDETSPFATVQISFSPMSIYSNGGQPNTYVFTYRPLWDPLNGTWAPFNGIPPVAGVPYAAVGDLTDQWTACDVFARHAQTARQTWQNPPPPGPRPYQIFIWVDPTGLGQPYGSGQPAGFLQWSQNEFYQYEIVY